MEVWKNIKDYEGLYQVSNKGKVRRFNSGKILKDRYDNYGYKRINLSKHGKYKTFYIHRLVGIMFLENKENKPQINHKNRNIEDNRVENIEWATAKENVKHLHKTEKNTKPVPIKCKTLNIKTDSLYEMGKILYKKGLAGRRSASVFSAKNRMGIKKFEYKGMEFELI